jgi:hypothetical protein
MKRQLTPTALRSYQAAPPAVRNAFEKQTRLLVENLQHPSLQAKKFDEARAIWQVRKSRPPYRRLDPLKASPQARLPAPQTTLFHEISRAGGPSQQSSKNQPNPLKVRER